MNGDGVIIKPAGGFGAGYALDVDDFARIEQGVGRGATKAGLALALLGVAVGAHMFEHVESRQAM